MGPPDAPPKPKRKIPKWLVPTVGYSIAIASLIGVFHQFDYRQLEQDVRTLSWGWVILGIALNLAVYVLDGWRWAVLLSPDEDTPVAECVKAVFVGQVANAVLPAKAGEVIRCYLLSFWTDTPFSIALTADAIGRVMDGICMALAFYLFTYGMPNMRRDLRDGAFVFAVGVLVLSCILLFILFRREHAKSFVSGNKWSARFAHIMHEIHCLGNVRTLRNAFGISILYLLMPILSVWALYRAYSFDFSFQQAAILLVIIHIGTTLPSAPANLGSFQLFATMGLEMLDAGPTEAKIFSVILYFAHTLPPIIVGAFVLLFTGLKLGEVHTHAKRAHHSHRSPLPDPVAHDSIDQARG